MAYSGVKQLHQSGALEVKLKFEAILEHTSVGILLVDRNFLIQYANNAVEKLFNTSQRRLVRRRIDDIYLMASLPIENIEQVFSSQIGFTDAEVLFTLGQQHQFVAEVNVNYFQQSQQLDLVVVEIHLVTHQRKLSEESQKQTLHNATKSLVRGLAHEIKNPLAGVKGAAQLLHAELPSPSLQEYTTLIIEQADRLSVLVDRLLGPNQPSKLRLQNIHAVIERTRTLAFVSPEIDIEVVRNYDPSIPDMVFDQDMVMQALLNVLNNAIQALKETASPRVEIKTRIERRLTIHGQRHPLTALISVIDNGPGIADSIKDTIFYPMISTKADGNGLGLSICQNLIEHHGGKIEVNSEAGQTAFTFYIPMKTQEVIHGS